MPVLRLTPQDHVKEPFIYTAELC